MGERLRESFKMSKAHWIAFFICLGVAIALMVGGALTPPMFVIDKTIFTAVAWLFGFAALAQVPAIIESGRAAVIKKGDASFAIGDADDLADN